MVRSTTTRIAAHAIPAAVCVFALSACGNGAGSGTTSSAAGSSPPASTAARSSGLVGADAKARCGGFGTAQAAEILGVTAGAVTERSQDITPTSRGCEFSAGDRKISFSLGLEDSIDDAKKNLENQRESYVMSARTQESATGKKIEEGAYSDILDVGDEAIWSVTNRSLAVRRKNLTILVMSPNDKRVQVAIARKILDSL
jgi:hypothetical protein